MQKQSFYYHLANNLRGGRNDVIVTPAVNIKPKTTIKPNLSELVDQNAYFCIALANLEANVSRKIIGKVIITFLFRFF